MNTKYVLWLPWATQIGFEHEEKKPKDYDHRQPADPSPPSIWPQSKIQCFFLLKPSFSVGTIFEIVVSFLGPRAASSVCGSIEYLPNCWPDNFINCNQESPKTGFRYRGFSKLDSPVDERPSIGHRLAAPPCPKKNYLFHTFYRFIITKWKDGKTERAVAGDNPFSVFRKTTIFFWKFQKKSWGEKNLMRKN